MREYAANGLLAATSLALLVFFAFIWAEGSHYIQEPNIMVLIVETVIVVAVYGFAVYNVACLKKRLSGSIRLSSCVEEGAPCNDSHIVFYIRGGEGLTPAGVNAVAEVIARATRRDTGIIFGVEVDPKLGDRVQNTVVAPSIQEEAEQLPSCLDKLAMTGADHDVLPSGLLSEELEQE